jgi:hypothetical protein
VLQQFNLAALVTPFLPFGFWGYMKNRRSKGEKILRDIKVTIFL